MPPSPDRISRARAREGAPLRPGLTLGSLLHAGALFDVYELRDSPRVAKILLPEVDASPAELRRALAISDELAHPRAHGITDAGDSDEGPYVLADRIEGESLLELALRRPGRIPPGEALRIVSDAADVVLAAHQKNLLHGALTASHVLVSQAGGVYVMGFGESRLRARTTRGPSAFEAPELDAKDAIATPSSDQWALAATLFALLTGESPYGGKADEARPGKQLPRRLSDRYPLTPRPLSRLMDRALATDPEQRFPDMGAFLAAMRNAYDIREVHYALPLRSPLAKEGDGAPPLVPSREPLSPPRLAPMPSMAQRGLPEIVEPPPPSDTRKKFPEMSASLRARAMASTVPAPALFDPVRIAVTEPPDSDRNQRPTPLPVEPEVRVRTRADTQPVIAMSESSPPSARRRREADLLLGITTSDESETEALTRVLRALERAVAASQDHGSDSPALNSALPPLMEVVEIELVGASAGLAFRVEPDRLCTQAGVVWEPPGALSIAVSRLAASGVQTLALLPGLDAGEIGRLVEVLAARDGFGTDIVTELYDADFAHVLFHAPDPLSGFATEARRGLEKRQRQLLALVDFDTSFQLEEAWQEAKKRAPPHDFAAQLEALSSKLAEAQTDVLRGEPVERESDLDLSRLSHITTSALQGPTLDLALIAFAPRIRELLEEVALSDAKIALTELGRMIDGLRESEATLEQRRTVFRAISSGSMLKSLFQKLASARADDDDLEALALLVPLLDAELAGALVSTLPNIIDHRLRAQVLHHLEFGISGHEAALGELAQEVDPKLGLEITRLLGRIETLAAKTALDSAAESPFAVIRVEALGLRAGASGEKLRGELKRLLEDATPSERILNLRAIRDSEIKFAAPFLALRVRSPKFDALEYEEKRLVFTALVALAPARAEALALDLLEQNRILSSSGHEDSRALAAEALGRTGASEDVLLTLEQHTRWRFGSSERVRSAAEAAHVAVKRRIGSGEAELPASPVPSQRAPTEKERPRDE